MINGKFFAIDDFDVAGHHILNWIWLQDIPVGDSTEGQAIVHVGGVATWATLTSSGFVSVDWDDITNKPAVFPPEDHTHPWGEITDQPTHGELDGLSLDDHLQYHNDARADTWFTGKDLADLGTKDHADLDLLLADDHTQYFLLAGRSGGQSAYGSPTNGEDLTLGGNPGANPGFIYMDSPAIFGAYMGNPAAAYGFSYTQTETPSGAFVGGGLNFSGDITTAHPTFIYESFRGSPTIRTGANPGFSAYTVLQALPTMVAGPAAGNHPLSPLILNCNPSVEQPYVGTRTVNTVQGINMVGQLRPAVSGATLNCTNWIGMTVAPTWNTAFGSICDFGNIKGMVLRAPAQALFGSSNGTERLASYYGLEVFNPTINNIFGTAPMAAVRSEITAGTNRYFLLNSGGAASHFNNGALTNCNNIEIPLDHAGLLLGLGGDVRINWNGSALEFDPTIGDDFRIAFAVGYHIISSSTAGEIRFDFEKFAFGQTSAVGNQVGVFAAPTRVTDADGDWADYLLSQSGNLTIDHTMSEVSAWALNAISITSGTGSIADFVATLNIGGMTTSNLGGAETHALRIQGRRTSRGVDAFEPLSPAQITADVDDYEPVTGLSMRQVWRLDSDASRTITGIAVQQENDTQILINIGSNDIVLGHQDASSTATNRMISPTGADLTLGPDEYAHLWHDNVTDRWRILESNGS